MSKANRQLPRARLTTDRRTGGAHRIQRELSAREELTLRLNEMHQENRLDEQEWREMFDAFGDPETDDDYYDHLLTKLENSGRNL